MNSSPLFQENIKSLACPSEITQDIFPALPLPGAEQALYHVMTKQQALLEMKVHTRKIIYACNFLITQIDFKHRLCTRSGCRDQQNGTVCVAEDSKKTQLEWAEKTGAETDFWLY